MRKRCQLINVDSVFQLQVPTSYCCYGITRLFYILVPFWPREIGERAKKRNSGEGERFPFPFPFFSNLFPSFFLPSSSSLFLPFSLLGLSVVCMSVRFVRLPFRLFSSFFLCFYQLPSTCIVTGSADWKKSQNICLHSPRLKPYSEKLLYSHQNLNTGCITWIF